jgi:CRISPR system Cascade subunit CasD
MRYLVFQCYAPLVSWGEIAIGLERHSSRQPSKSAIIGLLAAALGIKRDDNQRMQALVKAIGFAVKMISGGTVLKDFHTAQVPRSERKIVYHTRRDELNAPQEKTDTVLSRREYRCDALSVVAVWLKDNSFSIEKIFDALQKPVFALYLGRKSCPPAVRLNPEIVEADTIKEAFSKYKTVFPVPVKDTDRAKAIFEKYQNKTFSENNVVTYFWEDCKHSGFEETQRTTRYDMPLSRTRWQFIYREERMAVIREEVEGVF